MALINCKECGKEISTEANVCPNCGAKQPKPSILRKVFLWLVIAFVAVIGIGLMFGESNEKRQERYTQARAECSQLGAKAGLEAPGSFDRGHEALAVNSMLECMKSRGFEVKLQ